MAAIVSPQSEDLMSNMEQADLYNFEAHGMVSQVFSTGDFLIWCDEHKHGFMCFRTICTFERQGRAEPGEEVAFTVRNGKVVTVEAIADAAAAPMPAYS